MALETGLGSFLRLVVEMDRVLGHAFLLTIGCAGVAFFVSAFAVVKIRDSDRSFILCALNAGFQICFDDPDGVFFGRAMTILVRAP